LSGSQEQTNEVLTYVRSRDALKALEAAPGVRNRYGIEGADFLARFPAPFSDASFEALFKYYGHMVDARFDSESGTAIIKAKAFTPNDAYQINRRLLDLSEGLVNRLSSRAQKKGIDEAQRQVDLATGRARTARIALTQFRNSQSVIDPSKQAVGALEISDSMIARRCRRSLA